MESLPEAVTAAEAGINWQTVAVIGVSAVGVWVAWKIFQSIRGS